MQNVVALQKCEQRIQSKRQIHTYIYLSIYSHANCLLNFFFSCSFSYNAFCMCVIAVIRRIYSYHVYITSYKSGTRRPKLRPNQQTNERVRAHSHMQTYKRFSSSQVRETSSTCINYICTYVICVVIRESQMDERNEYEKQTVGEKDEKFNRIKWEKGTAQINKASWTSARALFLSRSYSLFSIYTYLYRIKKHEIFGITNDLRECKVNNNIEHYSEAKPRQQSSVERKTHTPQKQKRENKTEIQAHRPIQRERENKSTLNKPGIEEVARQQQQ